MPQQSIVVTVHTQRINHDGSISESFHMHDLEIIDENSLKTTVNEVKKFIDSLTHADHQVLAINVSNEEGESTNLTSALAANLVHVPGRNNQARRQRIRN